MYKLKCLIIKMEDIFISEFSNKYLYHDGGAFVILLLPLLGGAGLENFGLFKLLIGWSSPYRDQSVDVGIVQLSESSHQ